MSSGRRSALPDGPSPPASSPVPEGRKPSFFLDRTLRASASASVDGRRQAAATVDAAMDDDIETRAAEAFARSTERQSMHPRYELTAASGRCRRLRRWRWITFGDAGPRMLSMRCPPRHGAPHAARLAAEIHASRRWRHDLRPRPMSACGTRLLIASALDERARASHASSTGCVRSSGHCGAASPAVAAIATIAG